MLPDPNNRLLGGHGNDQMESEHEAEKSLSLQHGNRVPTSAKSTAEVLATENNPNKRELAFLN